MSGTTLPQLYIQTLSSLLPIFTDSVSVSLPTTQALLAESLANLYLIERTLRQVGVWSENEGLREVSDRGLVFMSVIWVVAGCEEKIVGQGPVERKEALGKAETAYSSFLDLLASYKIVSPQYSQEYLNPSNPEKRRESKIAHFKKEKELRQRISSISKFSGDDGSPLSFLITLLNSSSEDEDEADDSEHLRQTILDVLLLLYTQTLSSLSSINMELQLLSSVSSLPSLPAPSQDPGRSREDQDTTWRLDSLPSSHRDLVSQKGKVLRPFTLLPSQSAAGDRERLKNDVFKQSWRLPTMSIDQYLEIERERGGIISGGGQASYDAPTESEQLAEATEMDGTMGAYDADEKKRAKDENWAVYTEENQKGAGNTTNRG